MELNQLINDVNYFYNDLLLVINHNIPLNSLVTLDQSNTPEIILSLGDALTAIGLLLTVFQLKSRSWDIVLEIRGANHSSRFFFLGGIGALFTVLSYLIKPVSCQFIISILGILAFFFFLASAAYLYYFGTTQSSLFDQKKARRFFYVLSKKVGNNSSNDNEIIVDIIENNIEEIVSALKKIRIDPKKDSLTAVEEYASWAEGVLRVIICDPKIANYIVKNRLTLLMRLLEQLKKQEIKHSWISVDVSPIFEQLFNDKESYLYLQYEGQGIAIVGNLYFLFQDPYYINCLKLLRVVYFSKASPHSTNFLDVFFKAFENSLIGLQKYQSDVEMHEECVRTFKFLEQEIHSTAYSIIQKKNIEKSWVYLDTILNFLGNSYLTISQKTIINVEPCSTIDSAYISCVYKAIESLARIGDALRDEKKITDEEIRLKCYFLIDSILFSDNYPLMRNILTEKIWTKIDGRFSSNIGGNYPTVIRLYLNLIDAETPHELDFIKNERKKLSKFLYSKLKPKMNEVMNNKKTKFKAALLPDCLVYNQKTEKFEFTYVDGHIITIEDENSHLSSKTAKHDLKISLINLLKKRISQHAIINHPLQ